MSRRLKFALWVALIGLGAAILGFSVARFLNPPSVQAPAAATDFALRDLAGKTHSLASWRGKVILLNFWATWCPPCRREIPLFIDLQRRYEKQGLQIVGISLDNPEAVARYWQEMRINYPLLIAADGQIAGVKIGPYHREELEATLKPHLLASKPASP